MAKKAKGDSSRSLKKAMLEEIQDKLTHSLQEYHVKVSDRKFKKRIFRAGKILTKVLAREAPGAADKKPAKNRKKANMAPETK